MHRTIDIHTHGIGGFDTRSNSVDDILRIAEIHGSCGVAGIVLCIYSGPIDVMRQHMEVVSRAIERQGQSRLIVRPGTEDRRPNSESTGSAGHPSPVTRHEPRAARILGIHLEGPFLNPLQCGALDPASFVSPRESILDELLEGFGPIVKVITVAPEREGVVSVIKKAVEKSIVVSMGHSDATYAEAEAGFRAGARAITHLFNAMRGFHHREPGLAGFGLLNKEVYVEVIADPFHLHPKTTELIFKTKEPERIILISDSVKETKTAASDKGIASACGTLQGGSLALPDGCQRLAAIGFDETIIANASTTNPRRYLGIRG